MNDREALNRLATAIAVLCGLLFVFFLALACCVVRIWGLETFVVERGVETRELQRRVDRLERESWSKP